MSPLDAILEAHAPYAWIQQAIETNPDAPAPLRAACLLRTAMNALREGEIRASAIRLPWTTR